MTSLPDFVGVTELAGDQASEEQLRRLYTRYYWASTYASDADVLEVACGTGPGLGYLARFARRVVGADISAPLLASARLHYGDRMKLEQFDAEQIPFPDASFDVVVMFEAIYYLRDASRFIRESRRVLRPSGHLLLATANKDLFDFTPSPYSVGYHGVIELDRLLDAAGFDADYFGDTPVDSVSSWQRLLRPVKRLANATGLMPESKRFKALAKRVVFGPLRPLPPEVLPGMPSGLPLTPIPAGVADTRHKVIFVEARRRNSVRTTS